MSVSHHSAHTNENPGILAKVDGRIRLASLFILSLALSSIDELRAVPIMIALAVIVWAMSGLSLGYLIKRLRYPSILIFMFVAMLTFFAGGTDLYVLGPLRVREEGLRAAALLASRFYSILTLTIACFSVTTLLGNIRAMRGLGMPYILVDIALLMARYLEVLAADIERMSIAMRLRGYKSKKWSLETVKTSAWLAGSMLVRSYDRAEGVYKAMRLRGYGYEPAKKPRHPLHAADWLVLLAVIIISVAIFIYG